MDRPGACGLQLHHRLAGGRAPGLDIVSSAGTSDHRHRRSRDLWLVPSRLSGRIIFCGRALCADLPALGDATSGGASDGDGGGAGMCPTMSFDRFPGGGIFPDKERHGHPQGAGSPFACPSHRDDGPSRLRSLAVDSTAAGCHPLGIFHSPLSGCPFSPRGWIFPARDQPAGNGLPGGGPDLRRRPGSGCHPAAAGAPAAAWRAGDVFRRRRKGGTTSGADPGNPLSGSYPRKPLLSP